MKKLFLSLSVVFSFLLYSLTTKRENPTVTPLPTDISESLIVITPTPILTSKPKGQLKDGTVTGAVADAYYGNIQVAAKIQNSALTDVTFLQYPNDRDRSIRINEYALPILRQEAISAQNARVDIVSGATDTSQAFIESLSSALSKAKSL